MTATDTSSNGVDIATLFATIDAVRHQPDLGRFQFRVANKWVSGTHNRAVIDGFYGAGQEHHHAQQTVLNTDHPAVLVGNDNGPTPAEYLLHALGACLMSGLGNIAAARGIELDEVTATVRVTSTCAGFSALTPASATASRAFACCSTSRARPRPRSSPHSCSSRRLAPPSTTL